MGAETFQSYGQGATPEEAFRAAREEALYEYGHRGYTGTLAEKSEFTLIKDSFDDIVKLAAQQGEKLHGSTHKALLTATTPHDRASVTAEALIAVCDERIIDKWGPAGCIEVEPGKLYLFFGWASS